MNGKMIFLFSGLLVLCCGLGTMAAGPESADSLRTGFASPPEDCRPMPFIYIGRAALNTPRTEILMRQAKESGFGGVTPIPGSTPKFLSEDYFQRYGEFLAGARARNMKLVFYDTPGFPSGLGIDFGRKHREFTLRRLDMVAQDVTGPAPCALKAPEGLFVGAVAMNTATFVRTDLTDCVKDGVLAWQAPAGSWKVMLFACVEQRKEGLAEHLPDYLNPVACDKFIEAVYDAHAKRFPADFGTTIPWTFFDDVALYYTKNCRTWTPIFNDAYRKQYGESPALLYPALWMDIGPETEAARVRLLSLRAELFAEGWPRRVNEWCRAHGMQAMGHPAGNYQLMPVDLTGDMIRFYHHCDIPLLDMIFGMGARNGFKVISSAATNYDRPLVGAEVFGGFNYTTPDKFTTNTLYQGTMEVFARGVNLLVPHAIWYDPATMNIPPLISAENPKIAADLPAYNAWAARCSYLLRGGRTVADVAILYPIAAMQGYYHFDNGTKYGSFAPKETDYLKVGHCLTTELQRDFTFLHPQTLVENCSVEDKTLRLNNKSDWQRYRVLILPAGRVVSAAAMQKAKEFWAAGGAVLATGVLPEKSAEFGKDAEVAAMVGEMFGTEKHGATNSSGGRAMFLPKPDSAAIKAALDALAAVPDVAFEVAAPSPNDRGAIMALHKVKDGRHVYFIANTTAVAVDGRVVLRGALKLEQWDPHTGDIHPVDLAAAEVGGVPVTRVGVKLDSNRSLFLVGMSRE